MFSWRRRFPPSSVVAFTVAGVCAAGAFLATDAAGRPALDAVGEPTPVLVAAADLTPGEALDVADLAVTTLPDAIVPPGALTDPTQASGRIAVTAFETGEVITPARLTSAGGPLTASVPPGLVAIAVSPDSSPTGIRPGDRVDVVATYLTARPYAAMVGEDLTVLQVAEAGASGTTSPPLTLLTDAFTATELARADATATLSVAVRGYEALP